MTWVRHFTVAYKQLQLHTNNNSHSPKTDKLT